MGLGRHYDTVYVNGCIKLVSSDCSWEWEDNWLGELLL